MEEYQPAPLHMIKDLEAETLQVKLANENVSTYRMISLNAEKIILYLSHSVECREAALFHINDNPGIVKDAIRAFDQLWEISTDITTSMRNFFN